MLVVVMGLIVAMIQLISRVSAHDDVGGWSNVWTVVLVISFVRGMRGARTASVALFSLTLVGGAGGLTWSLTAPNGSLELAATSLGLLAISARTLMLRDEVVAERGPIDPELSDLARTSRRR